MRKGFLIILFLIFSVYSFVYSQEKIISSYIKIDTIVKKIDTMDINFIIYTPMNCNINFTTHRPDSNDENIKLSIAAAFTGKDLKSIMGHHIENGKIKWGYRGEANGYARIINNDIKIFAKDRASVKRQQQRVLRAKGDMFMQMLLVKDSVLIPCKIFGNRETFRRALVLIDKNPCIIESNERLRIDDFSQLLLEMGIKDALCLDMGTWSHGWVRTKENTYIQIGKLVSSTKDQTNWLIFTQK